MEATKFAQTIAPWSGHTTGALSTHLSLAIRQAITTGLLADGERLPPERAIAGALHISRPTVSVVMDDLRQRGLVQSRQGSGTWVTSGHRVTSPPIPFAELLHAPSTIDMAAAIGTDASLLPNIRIETADLLTVEPANGLNPVGLPMLRAKVAERTSQWVPAVTADNVIITSGAHQALALLIATLIPRGSTVLVEDVTYGGLIDLVQANGSHVIGIERDADGVRPDSLRELLNHHQPAMTVLVASVHSPSGAIASDERSSEIAQILNASDSHVVIDETYADLEFEHSDRTLVRETAGKAILVGSLSKSAWAGIRTGWLVAATETCQAVVRQRWSQFDLGPPVPSQLMAQEVLRELDNFGVERRARLAERHHWLEAALTETFPDWELAPVHGGLALWAKLPVRDSTEFVAAASRRGVALLPGSACRADRDIDSHIRLCFDRSTNVMAEAMNRIGNL